MLQEMSFRDCSLEKQLRPQPHGVERRDTQSLPGVHALYDFVAISLCPFFIGERPDTAFKWLTESFDHSKNPMPSSKTNDTAERTEFPKSKIVLNGTLKN